MAETLSAWRDRFLDDMARVRRLSPLTVQTYRRELERFLTTQKLTKTPLTSRALSPLRFQDFLASLAVAGLANRSIARTAAVLRSFLSFLHRDGGTADDWSERVPSVKFTAGLPRFVGESQMRQWLAALPGRTRWDWRARALVELMYATGARVAEVVGLNWADFDREKQTVRLFGKRDRERLVPVGRRAARSLGELAGGSPDSATAPECPIFVNRSGARLTTRSVARILQKTFALAVGGHVTPHRLRHTFATHMLDRGADLLALRELLGHQSVATTQVYTHTTPHRLQEVYRRAFPVDDVR